MLADEELVKRSYLKSYRKAIKCMKDENIKEAHELFEEMNRINPSDRAVAHFLAKCADHLRNPNQEWVAFTRMK